jgi:hypothetical protein
MTQLTLALLLSISSHAAEAPAGLPAGLRCESVKKSAVEDLPRFCRGSLDKRRLVDYGYQLDMLEKCGEADLAKEVKSALQVRVHRADEMACAEIAQSLAREFEK